MNLLTATVTKPFLNFFFAELETSNSNLFDKNYNFFTFRWRLQRAVLKLARCQYKGYTAQILKLARWQYKGYTAQILKLARCQYKEYWIQTLKLARR